MSSLGAQLPPPGPFARREEIRTTLVAQLGRAPGRSDAGRPPRRWWLVPIATAAAAAAWWLWPVAPPPRGLTVAHSSSSILEQTGTKHFLVPDAGGGELVRLIDGALSIRTATEPARTLRVFVGDGELSARNAAFDVSARDNRLAMVRVLHGRVEVRTDRGVQTLEAPAVWREVTALEPEGSSYRRVRRAPPWSRWMKEASPKLPWSRWMKEASPKLPAQPWFLRVRRRRLGVLQQV